MKVTIGKLTPGKEINLEDSLPLQALNQRMNEAPDNDIVFLNEPRIELTLKKKLHGSAELKGKIQLSYNQPCSRCNEEIQQPVTFPVDIELRHKQSRNEAINEDDVGIQIYEGDTVDLEEILQEIIILKLSPYLLPECNSNGDCSLCGKNFKGQQIPKENTFALGDLLKDLKKN